MTPAEFMSDIILPTVHEFRDEPRDRRRAYLACILTFTLCDHLKTAGAGSVHQTMAATAGDDFHVVRAIANGSKHVAATTGGRFPHAIPFDVGADWDRPPARAGELVCGVSRLGDGVGGREISTPTGDGGRDIYASVQGTLHAYQAAFPSQLGAVDLSTLLMLV